LLGFHHFYTGETGSGITHLLLSIVAAVLLWSVPEVSYCYYIIMAIICIIQAASYGKAYDKWGRPFV
jgi:TM2 domain-containing membrane protein YozV